MDNLKRTESREGEVFAVPGYVTDEDEISLIDIWLVLVRRKRVIFAAILLGGVIASAWALLIPPSYRFFTTLSLGQLTLKNGGEMKILPLDTPQNALAKLQNAYIPQVQAKWRGKNKAVDEVRGCNLVAKIPKDSHLVMIEAKAREADGPTCLGLISQAAQALVHDHDSLLAPVKARLSAQLDSAKLALETLKDDRIFAVKVNALKRQLSGARHKLSALEDQKEILENRYAHIDTERELTTKALQDNTATLKTAVKNRAAILKRSSNPATAVTLLTLGNEIQHYQDRIASLDQRLSISLPEKREALQKQLEANKRAQQQQTDLIAGREAELAKLHIDRERQERNQLLTIKELESRIAEMRPTRILRTANMSPRPVSASMSVKVVLGLMLGLMLGMFAAFVTEFLAKADKANTQLKTFPDSK